MCEITNLLHSYPKRHGFSLEWISSELWNQIGYKVPTSTLQAYLSPNNPTPFPAYLIVPFCTVCNRDFSALDLIEAEAGRIAMDYSGDEATINLENISKLVKEAGEAISILGKSALSKRSLEENRQKCIKKILDLQNISTAFLKQLYK